MDRSGVVQATLAPGHECRAAVQGTVLVGESNESRIFGLVECGNEFAIFMYTHRRMAIIADDVSLEEIVPISENFIIEEVIQNTYTIEVSKQAAAGGFPLQFQWVAEYQQKKDSLLHRSREEEFTNDTVSSFTCAEDKMACKISGDSDLLALELDQEKVTEKEKDNNVDSIPEKQSSDFETFSEASTSSIAPAMSSPEITDISNSNVMVTNKGHILGMPQFVLRDNLIKSELVKQEEKFTYIRDYRIFAGTYNVNGKSPKQDLKPWLSSDSEPPDIYCIGFQEIDLSKEAFLFNDTPKEEEWFLAVSQSLHPLATYAKIKLVRLVGMMLLLYVRKEHAADITEVEIERVGTGIMGRMGNKGGVSIRFQFHNTSLCIVNSHLAAHTEECERRKQDYREICSRMRFIQSNLPLTSLTIMKHDIIIWLGDLNYRICHPEVETIKKLITAKDYEKLIEFDQLTNHMKNLQVFRGFKEGPLNFHPTYKYDVGTDDWDTSEKCRVPAWCDRILWKGRNVKQLDYRSHMALRISDHKPVSSLFQVGIKVVNQDLYKKTYENIVRSLDRMENDSFPSVSLSKTEFHFENVKFMQLQVQTLVIANTGLVPCQFEFINKLNELTYCKPWFSATPNKGILIEGDRVEIDLEVYVNKTTALSLNMGVDRIEDILILHLKEGKDYFLAISGNYLSSCFGSSLHALCCMKEPIRDVLPERIQELERKAMENKYADCFPDEMQLEIPKEIWTMVDHLHRNASLQDDLFQQPGLKSEFEEIRDCLDTGIPEFLSGSGHSICEALLLFLDALPEPVITYQLYDKCLESSSSLTQFEQVVDMLPQCHRNVFNYLMAFLRELLKNASSNNLDVAVLASIFGAFLLRPPPNAANHYNPVICKKAAQLFISRFLTLRDG
ncbi:type II inositol 1,4,5-trisphosphate 5-phosphatase isoform X3 [Narcine bancroftii]|uniref:type II inositol 1,4,5-trisphosphate 5-phosphatase isoform X3 n=1 Tax=Narcine bancroftii TaxID=1343680 RepID=UPI00383123AD